MNAATTNLFRIRLQLLIDAKNINQSQLSKKSGVTQPTISRLINGETKELDDATAEKLAKAFEKPLLELTRTGVLLAKPTVVGRLMATRSRELLKKVGTGAAHFATGGLVDGIKSISEAFQELASMGPEGRAWMLVQRALTATLDELFEKARINHPHLNMATLGDATADLIEEVLTAAKLIVDQAFFNDPTGPFLDTIRERLQTPLVNAGMDAAGAKASLSGLRSFFIYALHAEEQANRDQYAPLRAVDGPLAPAVLQLQQLNVYQHWLIREMAKPVFGSDIPLDELYIPLRCSIHAKADRTTPKKKITRVHKEVHDWLNALTKEYNSTNAIRFLTAGPGGGKSTTGKKLAAELTTQHPDWVVVFAPLHRWPAGALGHALEQFANDHEPRIPTSELQRPRTDGLLVLFLDGLDELAKSGDAGLNAARDLVSQACQWLQQNPQRRCAILFAGRPIATEYAANTTIPPEFVFHLEPYWLLEEQRKNYEGDAKLKANDDRDVWWLHYSIELGRPLTQMPPELKKKGRQFDEITSQPLLGYLVAREYLKEPRTVDFGDHFDLAELYASMLREVHDKNYGTPDQPRKGSHQLDLHVYEDLLEHIGWCAWSNGGRAVTEPQVQANLPTHLKDKLREIGGAPSIFMGIYAAPSKGLSGETAYEFTHKSFGEYLAARHLAKAVHQLQQAWQRRQQSTYEGLDTQGVLVAWAKLFGPMQLTDDVMTFLNGTLPHTFQAANQQGIQFINTLLGHVLRHGFPMELALAGQTFHTMNEHAIHAEESLLACRAALVANLDEEDIRNEAIMKIEWPDQEAAHRFLGRLVTSRPTQITIAVRSLIGLDLSYADLSEADLGNANLRSADLSYANLSCANLRSANLRSANLRYADLSEADLGNADLSYANLTCADLSYANLSCANLSSANLSNADLSNANLSSANLRSADLSSADLSSANLRSADLSSADLSSANLRDANLIGAKLRRSQLSEEQLGQIRRGTPAWQPEEES